MSYMLRHLLCTIFVRKTACRKYCFQILSPPKKRSYCESQKSGFGFYPKNPPRVWILWVDDPFLDLRPPPPQKKKRKIRFWIRKSGFEFSQKHRTHSLQHWVSRCARGTTHPILWWFNRFLIFFNPFHTKLTMDRENNHAARKDK